MRRNICKDIDVNDIPRYGYDAEEVIVMSKEEFECLNK
jgi:hypothetical protein